MRNAHFQNKEPILENVLSHFRFNRAAKFIPDNSDVLDLGCGYNGNFLKKIEKHILSGVGVDMDVSTGKIGDKLKLVKCDLNRVLPFGDGSFDAVVSLANLEHLEDPVANLAEIFRVLRPGGILILTTPTLYAKPVLEFLSFKLHLVSEQEVMDHKNYFNKKILNDLLSAAGFSFIRHNYFQLFMNNFVYAKK